MTSFRRLWNYLGNYRGWMTLAIVCNILTAIFTVVSIPLLQPFFDILFEQTKQVVEAPVSISNRDDLVQYAGYLISTWIEENGRESALAYVCGFILLSFLLKNFFRYMALFFMAPVRNGIVYELRNDLYSHLMKLPLGYFSETRKGRLLARITSDVQEVEAAILNVLEAVFREPFIIIGALSFMFIVSTHLTLFVFGLMLFTGIVIGGVGKQLKRSSRVVQDQLGEIISTTEEGLGGLRIIKSFGAENYQSERFAHLNANYRRALTRLLRRRDLSSPLTEFLGIATVAVLLWYGSRQVFNGELDAGTFIPFIYAFYIVIDPAKKFSKAWYSVQKGLGAMERIDEVLDAGNPIAQNAGNLPLPNLQAGVRFENVHFRYTEDGPWVLQNINLELKKGKVVALAGSSGSGKSTIADLLPRFYDPTEGRILLDGHDLRDYRLKDLRARFGIVSQEAILFHDTIFNNIAFGLPDVSPAEVVEAARVANAHEFISASPDGYQTMVGDRGTKLSGGQRQRITIARAILCNPDILILDEATSALDSESERLVQEALQRLMADRTALVIAHRLSTIQNADEIIILEQGSIIERGTHKELLERQGAYSQLVDWQEV